VSEPPVALELRAITKRFPGVVANESVDLDVRVGEVHALLGENGAGKSTLMKIAYGFYQADSGTIRVRGDEVRIRAPHDARALGIGMLFQNFTLIPAFGVVENVALFLPHLEAVLDRASLAGHVSDVAARYQLDIDPWQLVGRLSAGEQQRVEVLKLLLADARILILDEPTSVLAPHEIDALFEMFERLKADGYAIVFITHKLPEVLACADRITIMRHGIVTGTLEARDASEERLIQLMFGAARPEEPRVRRVSQDGATPLLELREVATGSGRETAGLHGVDLVVHAGEVVGVAGVGGSGQRELGDVVLGTERCADGAKILFGKDATGWSVWRVRKSGVAFIPENAMYMAVVPTMSADENMALADRARFARSGGLSMDWGAVRASLAGAVARLGLPLPSDNAPVSTFSGGMLQRFVLARELARDPKLVVALYPTRGLDVPTAAAAQGQLLAARDAGAGVLLISQDLGELFALSDRIVVLRDGKIVGECKPHEATPREVGRLMTGAAA
jgi:general nucleoside transport system ATP-binding protein